MDLQGNEHGSAGARLLNWLARRVQYAGTPDGLAVSGGEGEPLKVEITEGAECSLRKGRFDENAAFEQDAADLNQALAPLSLERIDRTGNDERMLRLAEVTWTVTKTGVELWLQARDCGFATFDLCGNGNGENHRTIHWETMPKIPGTQWVALLALAEGWTAVGLDKRADWAPTDTPSPAEVLVRAYLGAIERLLGLDEQSIRGERVVGGGLRRTYDPRAETLRSRLRGSLHRGAYLRELSSGRPDRVPCRFHELDIDNVYNRALRWGLHLCMTLLGAVQRHGAKRESLEDRLRQADARFAGVSWARVSNADLPQLKQVHRGLRAYEDTGALPVARMLLERAQLGGSAGGRRSVALAFCMHQLFERAFAEGLARLAGKKHEEMAQQGWDVKFSDSATNTLKPDVYLSPEGDPAVLVADTKWKDIIALPLAKSVPRSPNEPAKDSGPSDEPELELPGTKLTFKVARTDLHQIIAYGVVARARQGGSPTVTAALVYPQGDVKKGRLDEPLVWPADGADALRWLRIRVVGWDVTQAPAEDLARVFKLLFTKEAVASGHSRAA